MKNQCPNPWVLQDQQRLEFVDKLQSVTGKQENRVPITANEEPSISLKITDTEEEEQKKWHIYHISPAKVSRGTVVPLK